jgi:hypothetical protein
MADNVKRCEDYTCDGCGSLYQVMWTTMPISYNDAGVTKRLWEMMDVVEMIEVWEAAEKRIA